MPEQAFDIGWLLRAWARWHDQGQPDLRAKISPIWAVLRKHRVVLEPDPTLCEECNRVIDSLDMELRALVRLHYLRPDLTAGEKARRVGLSRRTYWRRVNRACDQISRAFRGQ